MSAEVNISEKIELLRQKEEILQELAKRKKYNKLFYTFPKEGPLRAELYSKHLMFMEAGIHHLIRAFMAGNRIGKSETGRFEAACHATGIYFDHIPMYHFDRPTVIIVASKTNALTKKVWQHGLLGKSSDIGTGMIPKDNIVKLIPKSGVPEAYETVYVRHKSGGLSEIHFMSYDQGREVFQGFEADLIIFDEEPSDPGLFAECMMRNMDTTLDKSRRGMLLYMFTPLKGLSKTAQLFLVQGKYPENHVHPEDKQRFVMNASWYDVPHLTEEERENRMKSMTPEEIEARVLGLPSFGLGSIYPILERNVVIPAFEIPEDWNRYYGVYITPTNYAVVWVAEDPNTHVKYIGSEYFSENENLFKLANIIKRRGDFINGVVGAPKDVKEICNILIKEGLQVYISSDEKEAQVAEIYDLFESGQLYIFENLKDLLAQFRMYRRDDKGKIVEENTEIMNAMRIALTNGRYYGVSRSEEPEQRKTRSGANRVTGY